MDIQFIILIEMHYIQIVGSEQYPVPGKNQSETNSETQIETGVIIAKFNVTDTTNPTPIANQNLEFSVIEIDGIKNPSIIDTKIYISGQEILVKAYTFNTTGEHIVKYILTNPTIINQRAFEGCSNLINIIIPDGVTSIDHYAFSYCSELVSIDIPDSVVSIGGSVFVNCSKLISITLPSSVTSIGYNTFSWCVSLSNITINATTPPTLADTSAFKYTNSCPIYVPSDSVDIYKSANVWSSLASRIQAIS